MERVKSQTSITEILNWCKNDFQIPHSAYLKMYYAYILYIYVCMYKGAALVSTYSPDEESCWIISTCNSCCDFEYFIEFIYCTKFLIIIISVLQFCSAFYCKKSLIKDFVPTAFIGAQKYKIDSVNLLPFFSLCLCVYILLIKYDFLCFEIIMEIIKNPTFSYFNSANFMWKCISTSRCSQLCPPSLKVLLFIEINSI